jgi:hypothetical protein
VPPKATIEPRSDGTTFSLASGAWPATIARKRASCANGMSSTNWLGARCGTLRLISASMLVWIPARVTNRLRPRPSAITSGTVCAPGR